MKKVLLAVLFSSILCASFAAEESVKKASQAAFTAQSAPTLRHVVIIKFKSDATAEQIKTVETAFHALKGKISLVQSLEWGTDVSKEKRSKGFTHLFFLTFKSQEDLDAYAIHPEHKAFVEILKPVLDDVFVLDYWSKK